MSRYPTVYDIAQATDLQRRYMLGMCYGSAVLSRGKVSSRGETKTTIEFPSVENRGGLSMVVVLSVASSGCSGDASVGLSSIDVGGDDVREKRRPQNCATHVENGRYTEMG